MKRLVIATVGACVGVALMGSPASAATPAMTVVDPGANAGYVITPSALRSVSASWTVPTVTCTAPQASVGVAVLLGNRDTGHYVTVGVDIDCAAGKPAYAAWLHVSGSRRALIPNKVGPGDLIEAAMKSAPGGFSGSLGNQTRGWADIIGGPEGFLADQAGILAFRTRSGAAGGYHPLANFGTLAFTDGRINGKPVEGKLRRLEMRTDHGLAMARTSKLQKRNGDFRITYLH